MMSLRLGFRGLSFLPRLTSVKSCGVKELRQRQRQTHGQTQPDGLIAVRTSEMQRGFPATNSRE